MALIITEREKERARLLVSASADGTTASGLQLVTPGYSRRMNDPMDLVSLAKVVETADQFTKACVGNKLELISDQIKLLQAQARNILETAQRDVELSHAHCNFQRIPGKVYHLYRKKIQGSDATESYFSMISPNEWMRAMPDEFVQSYRLEYDMSWTALDDITARDKRRQLDPVLLGITTAANPEKMEQTMLALTN